MFSNFPLSKELSVQPEVVYSRQGANDAYVEDKLNYINIPILVQYRLKKGFRFHSGPQLGLLASCTRLVAPGALAGPPLYRKFDASWVVGMEYKICEKFGVDARYNYGISDINNDPFTKQYFKKNRVLQVDLSYNFR